MGDFSRNTFKLTNVMYQFLTDEEVADPRHYVGVLLQQAVPLIDADVREREAIQRIDNQIKFEYFFGDGIPSGNNGFKIGPVTEDNNFTINSGIALVSGKLVFNPHNDLTYLGQDSQFGIDVDVLEPPISGKREDLIYLDVWEEEIGPSGQPRNDERLINPAIGIETCLRIERRWLVRVASGISDISGITQEDGHVYMSLVRILRKINQKQITADDIIDLRRIDINVAKYLKIPLFVERGENRVDSKNFADMLDALRNILNSRLENKRLFINSKNSNSVTILHFAIQHILQVCTTGSLQSRTNNLTNNDALQVLISLINAQREYLDSLAKPRHGGGGGGPAKKTFIEEYNIHLANVQNELNVEDLLGAYQTQLNLNEWLSLHLEGNVTLKFVKIDPSGPLEAGTTYTIFVEITSGISSEQSSEVFDISASLTPDLWRLDISDAKITLDNVGGANTTGVVGLKVRPDNRTNKPIALTVVASVNRNPTIKTEQLPLSLQIGEEPLRVLTYGGLPPLNAENRLEISRQQISKPNGTSITFLFENNTAAEKTYKVEWFITLSQGSEKGWSPLSSSPESTTVTVPAHEDIDKLLDIKAPRPPGALIGKIGTLNVTVRGGSFDPGEEETLVIDFIVR